MTTLDWGSLRDRAVELDGIAREAWQQAINAWAECARLELIRQCEQNPIIIGLTFESEYQYDDEGGYFRSATIYPLVADNVDFDDDHSFADEMNTYGVEVLAVLCGTDSDGQITLDEARERRFV